MDRPALTPLFRRCPLLAGGLAVALGALVMAGWHLHLPLLIRVQPGWTPMAYSSALAFALTGLALLWTGRRPRAARWTAGAALFLGAWSVLDNLGLPVPSLDGAVLQGLRALDPHPGRMAPSTAISFGFLALGLLWANAPQRPARRSLGLALLASPALGFGATTLLGYLADMPEMAHWGGVRSMAAHTALGLLALGLGLLARAWEEAWEQERSRIPSWLPLPLVLCGMLVTFATRQAMRIQEAEQLVQALRVEAEDVRARQLSELEVLRHTLERMARRWDLTATEAGAGPAPALWADDASAYLAQEPLLKAMAWVDPAGRRALARPEGGTPYGDELRARPELAELLDRTSAAGGVQVSPVLPMDRGGEGFVLAAPLHAAGRPAGFLVAMVDLGRFMEATLEADQVDPAIFEVRTRDRVVFRSGEPALESRGAEGAAFLSYRGLSLRVDARPGASFLSARHSRVPEGVMAMGFAASILLGLAVHMGRAAARRAREAGRALKALTASEERFRLVQRATQEAIWDWDLVTQGILWNDAICTGYGYAPGEVGATADWWIEKLHPEDRDAVIGDLEAALEDPEVQAWSGNYRFQRRDGSYADVEDRGFIVRDAGAKARRMIGAMADVSSRRAAERVKDEFVSMVSHELRTPLTSIRGALGLIKGGVGGGLAEEARPLMDIALQNSERLVTLVNDLLDLEKMATGRVTFLPRPLELGGLVRSCVAANEGLAATTGCRFTVEGPEAPCRVLADPDRLQQVLANLLSNAAKFSPQEGEVLVAVSRSGDRCRVSVRDQGPGIPAAFRPKLFQAFSQADGSATRKKGGTGLGLHISRTFMERMGGSLGFESEEGHGATFHLELPVLPGPEVMPHPTAAVRGRVLVVEDDPVSAAIVVDLLAAEGFSADLAPGAESAKDLLRRQTYLGVVLDLLLPGQSGLGFVRDLRALEADRGEAPLPVVVVSVAVDEGGKALADPALDLLDWLPKPVDPDRFRRAVQTMADRGRRVLHVEDDEDMQELVRDVLEGKAKVDAAASLEEAHAHLASSYYDLLLLDLSLAGSSGMKLLDALERLPEPPEVVVFSGAPLPPEEARRVQGVLLKGQTSPRRLLATVEALLEARSRRLRSA